MNIETQISEILKPTWLSSIENKSEIILKPRIPRQVSLIIFEYTNKSSLASLRILAHLVALDVAFKDCLFSTIIPRSDICH